MHAMSLSREFATLIIYLALDPALFFSKCSTFFVFWALQNEQDNFSPICNHWSRSVSTGVSTPEAEFASPSRALSRCLSLDARSNPFSPKMPRLIPIPIAAIIQAFIRNELSDYCSGSRMHFCIAIYIVPAGTSVFARERVCMHVSATNEVYGFISWRNRINSTNCTYQIFVPSIPPGMRGMCMGEYMWGFLKSDFPY